MLKRSFRALLVVALLAPALRGTELRPLPYAPAPADNPLKGFVPYDTAKEKDAFPHSLEWFYLPLASLMPTETSFDWTVLEQHLNAIASRGHQAVMRVYLDYPRRETGIPKFLLAAGLVTRAHNYSHNEGKSLCPDYEDPRLRAALRKFVAAFGARYDGDPRLAFVTVGLLGYWGEWHTSDHKEWFASKTVQREVMDAYRQAFHRTRLLLRYPAGADDPYYADNHALAFGYHDDSFAWATMPTGQPNSWYFLDRMTRAGALDQWRTQPIGGEVRPEVWNTLWDEPSGAPRGQEYDRCVAATHATWLMNSGVFRQTLAGAARERALAGARQLGYEFHVAAAAVDRTRDSVAIRVRLRNTGVAPFYYRWPFEIALLDDQKRIVATQRPEWDLTQLAPATAATELRAQLDGDYRRATRVLLRVVNPLANGVPLRFANPSQDADLPGWLTLGSL